MKIHMDGTDGPQKIVHLLSGESIVCGLPAARVFSVSLDDPTWKARVTCALCEGAMGPPQHVDFSHRTG